VPDQPKCSTIGIALVDPEIFKVEIDLEVRSLEVALCMVRETERRLLSMISDAEAIAFQQKMAQAAQAGRAIHRPLVRQ